MRASPLAFPGLVLAVAAGCGEPPAAGGSAAVPEPAVPIWDVPLDDARLEAGRVVWRETCRPCHGTGLAGAPRIGDRAAWAPRIAQGMDVLVRHAVEGFSGRSGGQMPARGGNPALSDEEVAQAVAFVTSRSH